MVARPLLVTPTYDGKYHYEVTGRVLDAVRDFPEMGATQQASSFLTLQFNRYWCIALNDKSWSHFIMLHTDLVPRDPHWMKQLIELADANNIDVLSAVSPIKNSLGLTSTALARKGDFGDFRRVTMREVGNLPEVFFRDDVAKLFGWEARGHLLVNTGLMCVRMQKRKALEQMRFTTGNWIRRNNKGNFMAISEPEDWNWSVQAQERGLTVAATRAVALEHRGEFSFRNDIPWGSLTSDPGDSKS